MSGSRLVAPMPPDWADYPTLVVHEQSPICVYSDDHGAIHINQQQWREAEDEVVIIVRPEQALTLCRAILNEAGIDPGTASREFSVKDVTANERQRRRREKLRDRHGEATVTVTANLASDVHEPHSEGGLAP
jgi:hypothetical protein